MNTRKTLIALAFAAVGLPTTYALAAPSHLTDAQYIAVARCDGLAASKTLTAGDATAFDALMKSEGASRVAAVADRAEGARGDALRAASHAGATGKLGLIAERDGTCQALIRSGGAATASIAGPHFNAR